MSKHVFAAHDQWLKQPGKKGQTHKDSKVRIVRLPPYHSGFSGWDISPYLNKWELIEAKMDAKHIA